MTDDQTRRVMSAYFDAALETGSFAQCFTQDVV